jgi:hypothetical protein
MGRRPGWGRPLLVPLSRWALWERGQGGEGRLAARGLPRRPRGSARSLPRTRSSWRACRPRRCLRSASPPAPPPLGACPAQSARADEAGGALVIRAPQAERGWGGGGSSVFPGMAGHQLCRRRRGRALRPHPGARASGLRHIASKEGDLTRWEGVTSAGLRVPARRLSAVSGSPILRVKRPGVCWMERHWCSHGCAEPA